MSLLSLETRAHRRAPKLTTETLLVLQDVMLLGSTGEGSTSREPPRVSTRASESDVFPISPSLRCDR